MPLSRGYCGAALALIAAYVLGRGVFLVAFTLGCFRTPQSTSVAPQDLVAFPGVAQCEDIHYDAASNRIFAACEDSADVRFKWWPPMAVFDDPVSAVEATASLHVINPETMRSEKLAFDGFPGSMVSTHGIDVIADLGRPAGEAVYIFVIQHPPSLGYLAAFKANKLHEFTGEKEKATIDIFHHVLGSSKAKYIRSVTHPLIKHPNDLFVRSLTSFYTTNDHFYTDGRMREFEDVYRGATWTDTIHVSISDLGATDPAAGIDARIALSGLHNNNGLGHGPQPTDILVTSAIDGVLHMGQVPAGTSSDFNISLEQSLQFDCTIDNPSYFSDPFANSTSDASGYVIAGLTRGIDLAGGARNPDARDPSMVWFAKSHKDGKGESRWDKSILFQDDGTRLRGASAALLVASDPKLHSGPRKAWLFISGFYSTSVIAVRVDLK